MLDRHVRIPERTGLFLDFDGTLAPIVATPEEARPLPGVGPLLDELAGRFALVAVVSGRSAADVADRLGCGPSLTVLGLYGLDSLGGPRGEGIPLEEILPDVERAAALVPGARVEPKGLQVAVHYRGAVDEEAARRVLAERLAMVAERHGLRLLEGKKVLELVARTAPTKGDVVADAARAAGLATVVYAGDDAADLDAFAAVERLVEAGLQGLKVAVRSDETPPELIERADLVVDGPAGLVEALHRLARG